MTTLLAVQIDSREPAQIQKLRFGGADKFIEELPAGDLLAMCDDGVQIAVERKTPSDLLHTLRDGRLFPQLLELRRRSEWAYLVITGGLYPAPNDRAWATDTSAAGVRETGWAWSSVQGALVEAQEIGVNVVFANGELDYEGTVLRLAQRDHGTKRVAPPREVALLGEAEAFLVGLPGIGAERARALLEHCGTAAYALQFLSDERARHAVPGVGKGLKRVVREALGLDPGWGVYVMTREEAGDMGGEPAVREEVQEVQAA